MISYIQSLKEIAVKYDGFIVDIWGVIHDGFNLYPAIVPLFEWLKKNDKKIVLLSNSPRLQHFAKEKLCAMSLPSQFYDEIYTAGEDCHRALRDRNTSIYQSLGENLYLIGRDYDRPLFSGLPYIEVNTIQEADFLLVTGAPNDLEGYYSILKTALIRKLPLICANADRYALEGQKKVICAGKIAETYEQMGGKSYYHGKPARDFYRPVLDFLSMPKERILAIGDSLTTDILGANTIGCDSLLILSGVHRMNFPTSQEEIALFLNELRAMSQSANVMPTYVTHHLE